MDEDDVKKKGSREVQPGLPYEILEELPERF